MSSKIIDTLNAIIKDKLKYTDLDGILQDIDNKKLILLDRYVASSRGGGLSKTNTLKFKHKNKNKTIKQLKGGTTQEANIPLFNDFYKTFLLSNKDKQHFDYTKYIPLIKSINIETIYNSAAYEKMRYNIMLIQII
jgi:hypothetical protein